MNQGKRMCLLAIVPLAAVFGMMQTQIHGAAAAVTTAQVHLRSAPSTSGQILATLARGTSVEQGGCEAGWCSVTFGARAGYVAERYLYVTQRATVVAPQGRGYTNSRGLYVPSPQYSPNGPPAGASAQCRDGTYSFSMSRRGTCSHHGGVARWL
jgi:uncharacterized protein YraI